MPNPNFTGTVPKRRCETCQHWTHFPSTRKGSCRVNDHHVAVQSAQFAELTVARVAELFTTDLTVCSDWTRKPD